MLKKQGKILETKTTHIIQFRLYTDENDFLQKESERQRCSMSELIRRLIREDMEKNRNGKD